MRHACVMTLQTGRWDAGERDANRRYRAKCHDTHWIYGCIYTLWQCWSGVPSIWTNQTRWPKARLHYLWYYVPGAEEDWWLWKVKSCYGGLCSSFSRWPPTICKIDITVTSIYFFTFTYDSSSHGAIPILSVKADISSLTENGYSSKSPAESSAGWGSLWWSILQFFSGYWAVLYKLLVCFGGPKQCIIEQATRTHVSISFSKDVASHHSNCHSLFHNSNCLTVLVDGAPLAIEVSQMCCCILKICSCRQVLRCKRPCMHPMLFPAQVLDSLLRLERIVGR